jgi:hypothetical protein
VDYWGHIIPIKYLDVQFVSKWKEGRLVERWADQFEEHCWCAQADRW